jgi:hypothetical protein
VKDINSAGIGLLLKFVEGCKSKGIQIRYSECSHPFANYLPYLARPGVPAQVESVIGPYSCPKCRVEFEVLLKTPDIKTVMSQVKGQRCPRCQNPAEFDELPEEYFSFLS